MIYISDELSHSGVKGMKWGVRKKDYRANSIRSAVARRQNAKVDKSFKKWKTGADHRETAIAAGKKANASKLAYEQDRGNKEKKAQFKADNKEYKKALRQNTTYRKGTVRQEVGKDRASKYMSAAKAAKKSGDMNTYSKFMNKHDVERAKARRAQSVAANRSYKKAAIKRSMKIAAKTAVASAAVAAGVKYAQKKGFNISTADIAKVDKYVKMAKKAAALMY